MFPPKIQVVKYVVTRFFFEDFVLFLLETMTWSRPETKGTVPLPRSLHTANVIGNKYVCC